MIIAIPIDDQSPESTVCVSFGRAPYFMIYDTGSGGKSIIDNRAVSSQGGAGIKAAQIVIDSNAEVLLTPRCGEKAAGIMKAAGMKMFKTNGDSIKGNIDAFTNGELNALEYIYPGMHG